MNRPVKLKTRPQLALESYLDALLQDATEEPLPEPVLELEPAIAADTMLDEFQLAVLEEQARDAHVVVAPVVVPVVAAVPVVAPVEPVVVEPVADVHLPPSITPPPDTGDGRPSWAAEPFECLLFDVAGLTLAVPLVCLGSIYSLEGQELTPLFGQPDWFLGILPSQAGNLKVLDTARWVMPDRYRDDFRQGLQYVISVQGYEWGLAVHQVSRSLRLDPNEIKWRSHRGQRPWLAGTVIEHMCALLDVAELAELIASGAVKSMPAHPRS
ncbi:MULTISPECIES: CheW domain-containing protein [Pseudomonas]|uniref:Chemotaxis protein CheW n=1 Tax=Pseudomonas palleroniana TaxID=191390 RepID=A0A0X7JZW6_9PSED|nr:MULTISPECIES: CheW domain-containing protein [Pseudomonas]KWU48957.1 chemotaxis protein CheW [Pseudomonas palleroniana]NCE85995.1 chemotaxis protein CheW [Pseudomonas sp. Q1]